MADTPPAPRRKFSRRGALFGALAVSGLAAVGWVNSGRKIGEDALSVGDAHAAARAGEITLVDIRRPDEWAQTGVGEGALALDMRDPAFMAKLMAAVDGDMTAPIALICARGGRSRGLMRRLTAAGFTTVLDVPEGMLGSGAGPGWIGAGLPVRRV